MPASTVYLVDTAGGPHTLTLKCTHFGIAAGPKLKVYQRASNQTTGEKNSLIVNLFQVDRSIILTAEVASFEDYKALDEMITKTRPSNYPIKLYALTKTDGTPLWNGVHIVPKSVKGRLDFTGEGPHYTADIVLLQGAYKTLDGYEDS